MRAPKYTPERRQTILNALKTGCTRAAAAAAVEIEDSTLCRWIAKYPDFARDVEIAEADAERRFTGVLFQEAIPHETVETQERTETVIRMQRTRLPDGTITETPIPVEVRSTIVTTRKEGDWRAAESFLKRRRSGAWSDRIAIDVDTEIAGLLAELAASRQDQVSGSPEERTPAIEGELISAS